MNKSHCILLSLILLLSACGQDKGKAHFNESQSLSDTSILKVALLPTLDCLPFSLAKEHGIYKQLGVKVKFIYYKSQMDIDQQLAQGKVDAGASDLFRAMLMQSNKSPVKYYMSTPRQWYLFAGKRLRVNKVQQLGDRMIGMARFSCPDYFCDYIRSQIPTRSGLLLRAQVNDIQLRLQMLNNSQIDAAVLPAPLSIVAEQRGHTRLATAEGLNGMAGLAVHSNINKTQRSALNKLIQGYTIEIDSLKAHPIGPLTSWLNRIYGIDSIPVKVQRSKMMSHAFKPQSDKVNTALKWMRSKNRLGRHYTADTLLWAK